MNALAHRCAGIVALIAAASACSISTSGDVERIPSDNVPYGLDETIPTTTTRPPTTTALTPSTVVAPPTTQPLPTEEVQLYFISGGRLVPYPQLFPSPASNSQVLEVLRRGVSRNDLAVGLRTSIPSNVTLTLTEDDSGVGTVDLGTGFFDTIPRDDQRFAIGQIVLTLLRGGLGQIRFTQAGQPISVPVGTGEQSAVGQAMTRGDYRILFEGTPVPTTTVTVGPPTESTSVSETTPTTASG